MVHIRIVQEKDKQLLYQLLQKHLYEMSAYYDDDFDKEGNYPYRYFDEYFCDPTRYAFFILQDDRIAGFVLLNQHSELGNLIDYAIAEFSILPKYRKQHIAKQAVKQLFQKYSGCWEIKYHKDNLPAANLWMQAVQAYHPEIKSLAEDEIVVSFSISTI